MSVSFEDFLNSARELLNNPNGTEIDFRNLISRSYYSVFHLSRQKSIALSLPIPVMPPKEKPYSELGSHEKIFVRFEKHSDTNIRALGRAMYQFKELRRKSDYELSISITKYQAQKHFYNVEGLIKELKKLNP